MTPSQTPNTQRNPDQAIHSEVESDSSPASHPQLSPPPLPARDPPKGPPPEYTESAQSGVVKDDDSSSVQAAKRDKKGWFGRERKGSRSSTSGKSDAKASIESATSKKSDPGEDHVHRWKSREEADERGRWGLGDDASMGFG